MRTTTISTRSILIVHGRDFKPAQESLMDVSMAALRAGVERDYPDQVAALDGVFKDIAYYGDLTNALLESLGKYYDESLDLGDRRNALNSLRAVPARKRFGIRQYDCLPGKSAFREFIADVAAPFLGTLGLTMPLVSCVSKDCAEYLAGKSDYANKVRERVRNKLCAMFDRGDQIMLITHGLGCLVSYDVLWDLSHEPQYNEKYANSKVDAWLTLGAPLGDNNIRKRLRGAKEKLAGRFPTNVISWHNVAAEDDYTCHDNTLADDFKKMMQHHLVSAVHDYHIYNLAVRYGKSNPHSSVGYYIHPRVAKIVVDWISAGAMVEAPKYNY
ncbi:MAG: hypothetical protein OER22_00475 [Gammaproteobacteria bacterium]|nr:hypothetical protein [Gammaproteobacteria bacterium]MDH3551068.1 hypothetical protein [Gammaproteobacteria bacterium]